MRNESSGDVLGCVVTTQAREPVKHQVSHVQLALGWYPLAITVP